MIINKWGAQMQDEKNVFLSRLRRVAAMYIDFYIACLIGMMLIFPIVDFIIGDIDVSNRAGFYLYGFSRAFPVLIIFSFKDFIYKNASIGKHLLNIEIGSVDGKKLSCFKLFVRSFIFTFIWPVECILVLLFNKRLGDYIFNTIIVDNN